MGDMLELVESPLSPAELGDQYRRLCGDTRFANLPGKIEIDAWGRIIMSPASTVHGIVQARLIQRLEPLGGIAMAEAAVITRIGVIVADVAWIAPESRTMSELSTPLEKAPDLCIAIASPSNSRKGLEEKVEAYLDSGADEAWLVFPNGSRLMFFNKSGNLQQSKFAVALGNLFDW